MSGPPDRKRIHVVVNPAAGRERPILAPLNDAWPPDRVHWTLTITQREGDGTDQARAAVEDGCDVVCAVGGDGTVSEVAAALVGSEVPLAILPGGTGNSAAQELGIPADLYEAAALVVDPAARVRALDALSIGSERLALLRVGVGFDARTMNTATRELKDQLGWLAYPVAALRELGDAQPTELVLELDGERLELDACAVVVANIGRLGRAGARFPGDVDPFDGLADVYLLRSLDLGTLVSVGSRMLGLGLAPDEDPPEDGPEALWHRTARTIRIDSATGTPLPWHADGNPRGDTPVAIECLPGVLRVIVPG